MLAMISLYRLPEYLMGPMANPYYHDLGLSKDVVGAMRASIGLAGSLLGITAGGLSAVRFGYFRSLIVGLFLQSVAIASFAILAYTGPDVRVFGAILVFDNFGASFAGVALVTYMCRRVIARRRPGGFPWRSAQPWIRARQRSQNLRIQFPANAAVSHRR